MYIISDDILEQLICYECKRYLSVKPVKIYPNRSIKCGRCVKSSDEGVTSLFGILANDALFKCINRYDGCGQLLTYSEVAEHEKHCIGRQYECIVCNEPFKGTSYDIFVHFKEKHTDAFLRNHPELYLEIDNELLKSYLYCKNDLLFFINVQYNRSNQELILNAAHLGSDQQSLLIRQNFTLYSIDRRIQFQTKTQSCNSVSEGNLKSFRVNILENDFQKKVIICRFYLNITKVENMTQIKLIALQSVSQPKEEPVRIGSHINADDAEASTSKRDDSEEASNINENRSKKKEHINLLFFGPKNAGKTTIVNQIVGLTGGNQRYLLFTRGNGSTAGLGRASFETDKHHFTIFDAPGGDIFTPNNVSEIRAGTCVAVFVISAAKEDEWTINLQHQKLAYVIGAEYVFMLINKMDHTTVNWNEATYNECRNETIHNFASFGMYNNFLFIPCSGKLAYNLREPVDKFTCPWYKGPAFIPFIDALCIQDDKRNRPFMMLIAAKYNDNNSTVVTGIVEYGECRNGQRLLVMPNKTSVVVDMLLSDDDEVLSHVVPGENVKIKVKGVKEEDVSPGFVICDAFNPVHPCRIFDALLTIFKDGLQLSRGDRAVMQIHCVAKEVTIISYDNYLRQKEIQYVQILCTDTICLAPFRTFPQMGKFILRDKISDEPIAIGEVVKLLK